MRYAIFAEVGEASNFQILKIHDSFIAPRRCRGADTRLVLKTGLAWDFVAAAGRMFDTRHMFVEGRVQGVGYRAFVLRHAERLGLGGWTRNRSDGTVEVCVCGEVGDIEALIAELRIGPPHGLVTRLRLAESPAAKHGDSRVFTIRSTV